MGFLQDTETGVLHHQEAMEAPICVQEFDDSLNPAIHITFSHFAALFIVAREPRYPLLKGVFLVRCFPEEEK